MSFKQSDRLPETLPELLPGACYRLGDLINTKAFPANGALLPGQREKKHTSTLKARQKYFNSIIRHFKAKLGEKHKRTLKAT